MVGAIKRLKRRIIFLRLDLYEFWYSTQGVYTATVENFVQSQYQSEMCLHSEEPSQLVNSSYSLNYSFLKENRLRRCTATDRR
jgi:hypothetical protein